MMKLTEAQLEVAIIEHLGVEGYPHVLGESIERKPETTLS
jgi:type I restriction enzyme R subunit